MNTSVISGGFYHVVDGIARLLLVALFALLPIVFIPVPWAAISQGKMAFVVVIAIAALLAWLLARLLEGAIHIPRSWLLYVAALLPIAYLVSTIFAGWTGAALVGQGVEQDTLTAVALWFAVFALSAFLLYGNQAAQRLAIQSFVCGLTVLSLFQGLYILQPTWFSFGLLSGNTANVFGAWHDLGIMAGLALFLSFALWKTELFKGYWKTILVALGILSTFLLVVIHFADVFWAVAALFFVAAAMIVRTNLAHDGGQLVKALKLAAPFIVVGAIALGAGFFGTTVWEKLPTRINVTQVEVRPSWQGTFDVAKQSLQAPSELIFGAGPNSFIREWGLHKPAGVNQTPFWDSDFNYGVGIIPTSIVAAGLFGLLAWGALLLVMLGLMMRFVREARPLSASRILFGVSLAGSVYLLAYHLIYTPSVAVTGSLFLFLGLLVVMAVGDAPARSIRIGVDSIYGGLRLLVVVILVLSALAAAGLIGRELLSNMYVNRGAYVYQTTGDLARASSLVNTAVSISSSNDRAHRAAAELGVVRLAQLGANSNPDDATVRAQLQETLQATIQHGLTAVSINETSYQNWLLLAQVYSDLAGVNVDGAYVAAENAFKKAFEANPSNPTPKLRLAQLAALTGNRAAARTYLNEAIALKPDFAAAHFLLSQVEAADGKGEAAVTAAASAVQLVPQDPLGWFNLGYILYAGGAYRDSALALQQAVSLAPDYSNALFYLALAYHGLQMPNDAVVALERVQQLNPSETYIAQMIANIKAGKAPGEGIQQNNQ